jgi:very-short-patch-repair endonuclease
LNNLKFRRQHPFQNYIADFYCHEIGLVIEIDGCIHNVADNKLYDSDRTVVLNDFALTVIRFSNQKVLENIAEVLNEIKLIASKCKCLKCVDRFLPLISY